MGLYVIGDLHLSFTSDKPMDVFGQLWHEHYKKIEENWRSLVKEEDTVIVVGDISWATTLDEAQKDLDWIDALPGKKILLRGNHDFWWSTLKKMRARVSTIDFLQNNAFEREGYAIVGTRGWSVPSEHSGDSQERKVFDRECTRLKLSLDKASHGLPILAFMHFPPFDDEGKPSMFNDIMASYGVKAVYFGHVHSKYETITQGQVDAVNYQLVSADYTDFKLVKIGDAYATTDN